MATAHAESVQEMSEPTSDNKENVHLNSESNELTNDHTSKSAVAENGSATASDSQADTEIPTKPGKKRKRKGKGSSKGNSKQEQEPEKLEDTTANPEIAQKTPKPEEEDMPDSSNAGDKDSISETTTEEVEEDSEGIIIFKGIKKRPCFWLHGLLIF